MTCIAQGVHVGACELGSQPLTWTDHLPHCDSPLPGKQQSTGRPMQGQSSALCDRAAKWAQAPRLQLPKPPWFTRGEDLGLCYYQTWPTACQLHTASGQACQARPSGPLLVDCLADASFGNCSILILKSLTGRPSWRPDPWEASASNCLLWHSPIEV